MEFSLLNEILALFDSLELDYYYSEEHEVVFVGVKDEEGDTIWWEFTEPKRTRYVPNV